MLTKRLSELVQRVPKCDVVLDVGCDHGFVACELLTKGIAKKVLLSDISEKSLEKARLLFEQKDLQAEFFVSDGVINISSQFDFCIVAGMGGLEILKIFQEGKIEKALLQPMNHVENLRQQLVKIGYKITADEIIFDGKFYNMINVEKGEDSLSELEILFGRTNLKNKSDDFAKYLQVEFAKKTEIIHNMPNGERKEELTKYIEYIKELLK